MDDISACPSCICFLTKAMSKFRNSVFRSLCTDLCLCVCMRVRARVQVCVYNYADLNCVRAYIYLLYENNFETVFTHRESDRPVVTLCG